MVKQVFVNLHVKDLERSKTFFTEIGFSINELFTNEAAACVVISDNIFAMLLTHKHFKNFTSKDISDATKTTEVLTAFGVESKEEVDRLVDLALKAGAKPTRPPEDYEFMYARSFDDPDGHIWEVFWMDLSKFPKS